MRLLIDEMHSPRVAEALRADGWDAVALAEDGTLRGSPDARLLAVAVAAGRTMVTEDSGDFLRLAHLSRSEGNAHCGIIITASTRFYRGSVAYPNNLIEALRRFLAAPPVDGDTWVWWLS